MTKRAQNNEIPEVTPEIQEEKKSGMIQKLLSNSKKVILMYVILFIWILFGVIGIYQGTDLTQLSIYFGSLAIPFLGFILGETWNPRSK